MKKHIKRLLNGYIEVIARNTTDRNLYLDYQIGPTQEGIKFILTIGETKTKRWWEFWK